VGHGDEQVAGRVVTPRSSGGGGENMRSLTWVVVEQVGSGERGVDGSPERTSDVTLAAGGPG